MKDRRRRKWQKWQDSMVELPGFGVAELIGFDFDALIKLDDLDLKLIDAGLEPYAGDVPKPAKPCRPAEDMPLNLAGSLEAWTPGPD